MPAPGVRMGTLTTAICFMMLPGVHPSSWTTAIMEYLLFRLGDSFNQARLFLETPLTQFTFLCLVTGLTLRHVPVKE